MKPDFSCTAKVNDCECADIAARSRLSRWAKGWCASALLHASTRVAVTVPASMRRRGRGGLPGARARFCVRRWHGSPLVHPLAKLRNLATCGNARSAVAEGAFPGTRTRIYAMRRQGSRLVHPRLARIAPRVPARGAAGFRDLGKRRQRRVRKRFFGCTSPFLCQRCLASNVESRPYRRKTCLTRSGVLII